MNRRASATILADGIAEDHDDAMRLVPWSVDTQRRLSVFVALLAKWRTATNLVSEASFPSIWTRHIADSAQLPALVPAARRWVDMGSGAGFPGVIIAILLADFPDAIVHCIESDKRKCAFLREAVSATGAKAIIHPCRVASVDASLIGTVEVVTARAFAPLPATLKLARVWLEHGAVGIFPRGRTAPGQIESLIHRSEYAIEVVRSVVDREAVILRIQLA